MHIVYEICLLLLLLGEDFDVLINKSFEINLDFYEITRQLSNLLKFYKKKCCKVRLPDFYFLC